MTKKVRIENADTSNFKVVVETWDKGQEMPDGLGGTNKAPDRLASHMMLHIPCQMESTYITNTRYLVVREATQEEVNNGLAPLTA